MHILKPPSPVDEVDAYLGQVLVERLEPHLVLVLQSLVELPVPMGFPGLHVVGGEALRDQPGHQVPDLHQAVLPLLLLTEQVHAHQLAHLKPGTKTSNENHTIDTHKKIINVQAHQLAHLKHGTKTSNENDTIDTHKKSSMSTLINWLT